MATFSLYLNVATGLLIGMTKNRPRLSHSVARASACLAGLSKSAPLHADHSTNCVSLAVAMARGTLLYAYGPTILTNPEPCSADFLSARAVRS